MKISALCAASVLLVAIGCADDEEGATIPCDVTKRACQKAVFKATAAARGQDGALLPPVRVITRKQLADELRRDVDDSAAMRDEVQALKGRQSQQAMALLHLLPEPAEQSSDDAYVEQAAAGIAAYYSSYSEDITVIADQAEDHDTGSFTLSHEFVHALQDQRENLSEWRKPLVETSDDSVSTKCLTEGEAVWLSYVTFYREARRAEPERIDRSRIFASMLSDFLGDIESTAAPFISALETLPYPMGGSQVANLYLAQGADAVSQLYSMPRLTLRQWADEAPEALPEVLDCELPAAPEGYQRILSDRLGFAGLLSLYTGLGWDGATAYDGALPWRSDEVVGYAAESEPEAVAVAWRLRLESAASADALAFFAREAQLDARALGSEVLITAATRPELADSWLPHDSCVASDKSRALPGKGRLTTLDEQLGIER